MKTLFATLAAVAALGTAASAAEYRPYGGHAYAYKKVVYGKSYVKPPYAYIAIKNQRLNGI